jgi:hypothetical protein
MASTLCLPQTAPFFILTSSDKDQFIKTESYWDYGVLGTSQSAGATAVYASRIVDGITFYIGYSVIRNIYIGMDEVSNKLYWLQNDSTKAMMLDFNIPIGTYFQGQFPGNSSPHNIRVTGTDSIRYYKYSYGMYPSSSIEYRVDRGFGLSYENTTFSMSNGRGQSTDYSTFELIRFKPNGDTLYKTQVWKPKILFTPVTITSTFNQNFKVKTGHDLNTSMAPYCTGFSYNDSLFMESYYGNGSDSTLPIIVKVAAGDTVAYVNAPLDSVKMKAGYKFKYRFFLRDKCFRPKLAFSPATLGYHSMIYDPSVGIKDEEAPLLSSFQLAAFPNPFNSRTVLQISNPEPGEVTVAVYSLTGKEVIASFKTTKDQGIATIPLDFNNLPSGVYFADVGFVSKSGTLSRKQVKLVYLK